MLSMALFFSLNESEPGMRGEKPERIWITQENLIKPDFQQAIFFEKKCSFEAWRLCFLLPDSKHAVPLPWKHRHTRVVDISSLNWKSAGTARHRPWPPFENFPLAPKCRKPWFPEGPPFWAVCPWNQLTSPPHSVLLPITTFYKAFLVADASSDSLFSCPVSDIFLLCLLPYSQPFPWLASPIFIFSAFLFPWNTFWWQRTLKMIVSHNRLPLGLSVPSVRLVSGQHGSPSLAQGDFRSGCSWLSCWLLLLPHS